MENDVGFVQLRYETIRKPRDARSPSKNRGQALREGHVVDGSGCGGWLQRFIGTPLEKGVEAWRQATVQVSSGQSAKAFLPPTDGIGRCISARHTVLGLCTRRMDRPPGAGHDPATVRRGVSSGICAAVAASAGLESAAARAASPRTKRSGHRPLASRILAATKKRASNVKLAWFFSMKVGFCCNHCGGECGRRQAVRRSSARGIDVNALRQLPPLHARRGRCGWDCTTNSWITTRGPKISFGSFTKSTGICAVQSFWCGIVCLLIVPPPEDCWRMVPRGSRLNGFLRMRRISILWRMFGISPSTGPWQTSFPKTSTVCTPNWIMFWTPFGTSPTGCIRSLTRHT
jgi:hypothetical protein